MFAASGKAFVLFSSERYYIRSSTGGPTGSHLVGFSRRSLNAMAKKLSAIHKADGSHLLGFDTFLERCRGEKLVRLAKESIAYQRSHAFVKRR